MTTNTPNLSLVLYDNGADASLTFNAFRTDIAGSAITSNFYKIDTAVGTNTTNIGTHTSQIASLMNGKTAVLVSAIRSSPGVYAKTGLGEIVSYVTGMSIILKLDITSTGATTLNINSLGAKSVMKVNTAGTHVDITGGELVAGKYYLFIYDGTRFVWVGATVADQIYIAGTSGNYVRISTNNTLEDSGGSGGGGDADLLNGQAGSYYLTEANHTFTDITTNNSSSTKHGYLPKLSNVATEFLTGIGTWATPTGGASYSDWQSVSWAGLTRTGATTFTTTTDVSGIIRKGTKLKLTDSTIKYFVVYSAVFGSGVTTITTIPSSDFALVGNPSLIYYSHIESPYGFPSRFAYVSTYTGFSSPTSGTGYWQIGFGGNYIILFMNGAGGTSNSPNFLVSLPVNASNSIVSVWGEASDAGVSLTTAGKIYVSGGTAQFHTDMDINGWTSTGIKSVGFTITYPI